MNLNQRTLTIEDLANKLHISKESARRLAREKEIPCIVTKKRILFLESDVEKYLEEHYTGVTF